MSKIIKAAVVQHPCVDDKGKNLDKSITGIRKACQNGVDLVLLPELHGTHYFCISKDKKYFDLAEPVPGPTTDSLARVAIDHHVLIIASIFEKQDKQTYYNTAVVIDKDGSIAGTYRKMHVPDETDYYEKFYFLQGENKICPVVTSLGKLGVMVCWDQWFPEAARLMALAGAEVLIYPSAIGWDPADDQQEQMRQIEAWQLVQRGNAVANCLPLIVCNRTGHEPDPAGHTKGIDFWGASFIAGPQGEILAQAGQEETIIHADIDLHRGPGLRKVWTFFRDRRTDAYQQLLEK